jgi:uncharacterized damage-inducible protein DinB
MNAQSILQAQMQQAHQTLEAVIGDCSQETLHNEPGGTVGSIASIYAHTVFDEDMVVNGMIQGKPPVLQSGGWGAKINVPHPGSPMQTPEWAKSVQITDLATFQQYAQAVYGSTDAFLASATDAEMERVLDTGFMGKQTVAFVLAGVAAWHVMSHQGEISALKGAQGQKGLPF